MFLLKSARCIKEVKKTQKNGRGEQQKNKVAEKKGEKNEIMHM